MLTGLPVLYTDMKLITNHATMD